MLSFWHMGHIVFISVPDSVVHADLHLQVTQPRRVPNVVLSATENFEAESFSHNDEFVRLDIVVRFYEGWFFLRCGWWLFTGLLDLLLLVSRKVPVLCDFVVV